jgi:hypothetical protein
MPRLADLIAELRSLRIDLLHKVLLVIIVVLASLFWLIPCGYHPGYWGGLPVSALLIVLGAFLLMVLAIGALAALGNRGNPTAERITVPLEDLGMGTLWIFGLWLFYSVFQWLNP